MRAAEKTYRVDVVVSERDSDDGITVDSDYRTMRLTEQQLKDATSAQGLLGSAFLKIVGTNPMTINGGVLNVSSNTLADLSKSSVTYTVTSGDSLIGSGTIEDMASVSVAKARNYTITISLYYDVHSAGVVGATSGDGVDDRDQVSYPVKLQSSIGSKYYNDPVEVLWASPNADIAKLVADGDYDMPGWDYVEYDGDDEYYYEYKLVDGTYVGTLVKGDGPKFVKTSTNDKDTNGDGKVSCDEYYGTTGLVWSDEKNACVVESNGAVVVTIPNTATK